MADLGKGPIAKAIAKDTPPEALPILTAEFGAALNHVQRAADAIKVRYAEMRADLYNTRQALRNLLSEHADMNAELRKVGRGRNEDGAHPDCPADVARCVLAGTAVNHHAALVEALRGLVAAVEQSWREEGWDISDESGQPPEHELEAMIQARKELASGD
jgi:hypothetical protein